MLCCDKFGFKKWCEEKATDVIKAGKILRELLATMTNHLWCFNRSMKEFTKQYTGARQQQQAETATETTPKRETPGV